MADYLTENAMFSCSMTPAVVIRCKEGSNKKVKYKGTVLLTRSAKINTKVGICPFLTAQAQGAPQPCRCSLSAWTNFSMNTKAQGTAFLTDSSKNTCMYGGVISVKFSGMPYGVSKAVKGSKASISSVDWLKPFVETVQKNSDTMPKSGKTADINNSGLQAGISSPQAAGSDSISKTNTVNSTAAEDKIETAQQQKKTYPNLLCNMDKGEKCKTCRYPLASTEVDNDSIKLRRNYENQSDEEKDDYDRYYEEVFGNFTEKYWTDAAHHIISGNQVFKKCREIVRLANFYNEEHLNGNTQYKGYDINSARNCIMLISKDVEYSKKMDSSAKKNISAYDAMSTTGIQWHLGGHSYTFSKEEVPILHQRIKLFTKKEARELKNYAELVEAELNKIQISMSRNKVCRATPRQNAAFVMRMNNLSAKIKKYLGAFRIKPHRSYPYYVSLEAFRYTFALPRTGKIMLVRQGKDKNSLLMEKFRVKRFEETITDRTKNLEFSRICNESDIQNPREFVFNNEQIKKDCIYFCDNIEHFILIGSLNLNLLPFRIEANNILSLPEMDEMQSEQFLQKYDTEILVFLRNNAVTYTAPAKKIKERLQQGG